MTGLLLTKKLSDLGFTVLLLERESTVASGPSIRNEGWLHRGTYHAFSIRNAGIAVQVARRCIYGHEQIKSLVPEAIESVGSSSFALLRDSERRDELLERWDAAGVLHREVPRRLLQDLEPNLVVPGTASVYEVQDVSIDTRIVYRKLLHQSL
ncbi:MAG TPA: FAD-dependent oxidoreductase, partial [Longimicrobium sp.]|nr:FAD-dependent oxidoreductase [Longimicrobium sp.]